MSDVNITLIYLRKEIFLAINFVVASNNQYLTHAFLVSGIFSQKLGTKFGIIVAINTRLEWEKTTFEARVNY